MRPLRRELGLEYQRIEMHPPGRRMRLHSKPRAKRPRIGNGKSTGDRSLRRLIRSFQHRGASHVRASDRGISLPTFCPSRPSTQHNQSWRPIGRASRSCWCRVRPVPFADLALCHEGLLVVNLIKILYSTHRESHFRSPDDFLRQNPLRRPSSACSQVCSAGRSGLFGCATEMDF
jgi:hypothetical protein